MTKQEEYEYVWLLYSRHSQRVRKNDHNAWTFGCLEEKGLKVQPFKAGPDFIDTGLHRLVTGRHSRNLDIWMCGEKYVKECFHKYATDADISIIEGVMGMYDGEHSTAKLAGLLNLPVILVVDAYGMAESAGAVVKGFREGGGRGETLGV